MKLLGVKISTITKETAIKCLNTKQCIFTPNPEILLEAHRNKKYKNALKSGTLMLPDGNGLQLVSTLMKVKNRSLRLFLYPLLLPVFLFWKKPFKAGIPEVIHGSDFMAEMIEYAVKSDKAVFFLGAGPDVAKKCSEHFQAKFPSLKVAGFSECDPGEKALEAVKKSEAEICFVAYGAPKQELWISKNLKHLPKLQHIMGVGGSFDFYSGGVKRAPKFLQKLGLEWLWRLFLEPKKRSKRIWNALVVFPITCFFSPS